MNIQALLVYVNLVLKMSLWYYFKTWLRSIWDKTRITNKIGKLENQNNIVLIKKNTSKKMVMGWWLSFNRVRLGLIELTSQLGFFFLFIFFLKSRPIHVSGQLSLKSIRWANPSFKIMVCGVNWDLPFFLKKKKREKNLHVS